jgi:phospholipid/cholesterol/gamma-HCH transport system substrate-binding protein
MMRWAVARFVTFAAISVAVTLWIGASIVGVDLGDRYQLRATFDDVAGLHKGDDVRLAGLRVGQVSGIRVVGGRADVRFGIDEGVILPRDTTVAVRWRNLIGQRYLSLEVGTSREVLAAGDQVARTSDVVDLGDLVNELAPLARSVDPAQLNNILTTLVAAFEGNEPNFDALVADLGSLTGVLADRDELIGQMLSDYATVSEAVASRDSQIQSMLSNLAALSGTFADTQGLLDRALGEFSGFASGADQLLTQRAADLGQLLEQLAILTDTTVADLDDIQTAVETLPDMLEALQPAINRGAYLRVNLLCVATGPGPCPHPLLFFEDHDKEQG